MRGRVVLPEFADGGALPAAAGFGAAFWCGKGVGKVLADVGGDGGARAMELETPGQFVGEEGKVERLAVGQEVRQEGMSGRGPLGTMVAARGLEGEGALVSEPVMAQFVEAGAADHKALRGDAGIELAGIEGGEDFLGVEGGDAVSELLFFIGATG
jgi:hypothetical protein